MKSFQSTSTIVQKAQATWGISVGIWTLFLFYVSTDLWITELVVKPLAYLIPAYYFLVYFQHKHFWTHIWWHPRHVTTYIPEAVVLVLTSASVVGWYGWHGDSMRAGFVLLIAGASAVSESILHQGFLTVQQWEDGRSLWKTTLNTAPLALFARVPRIVGMVGMPGAFLVPVLLLEAVVAIVITMLFLMRKSLWTSIVFRFAYTAFLFVALAG